MRKTEIIMNETYNHVEMFIRDLFLSKEIINLYTKGLIITDPGFTEITYKIGGMNANHNTRFIILSNRATDMQDLEESTSWGLYVIHPNAYFKTLDILTINNKTIIILLHINSEDKDFFKDNNVSYDTIFINNIITQLKKIIDTDPIPDINNDLWARHVNYPIGINENNHFFK